MADFVIPYQFPMQLNLYKNLISLLILWGTGCFSVGCMSARETVNETLSEARCILATGTNQYSRTSLFPEPKLIFWSSKAADEIMDPVLWALSILRYDGNAEDLPLVEHYTISTNNIIRESASETMQAIQRRRMSSE